MNSETLKLNPTEQKYIGTCYPLSDRPGLAQCNVWKGKIKTNFKSGENISIQLEDLREPFPYLYNYHKEGLFNQISIQQYFESIELGGHIQNLYKKGNSPINEEALKNNPKAKSAYLNLLEHYEGCSVKLANLTTRELWGFGGIYDAGFDLNYFEDKKFSEFVLVHGKSASGHIVIRSLDENEVEKYKIFFENLHKDNNNIFTKYKQNLEELLK